MYKKKKKNVKKFRKNFNARVVKSKQTYSVEEISELLHVHKNTVGIWLKSGLQKIDHQQPYVVFGQDLIDFINAKNSFKKHPCSEDKLFCCKCQEPRRAKDNIVQVKINNCRTNMTGICDICGTKINKTISPQKVSFYKNIFNVEAVQKEDLLECIKTSAIVDKKQGYKNGKI